MKKTIINITLFMLGFFLSMELLAQSNISGPLEVYVFPTKEQDKEQQEFDEYTCFKWAKEQSGIDPINPPDVQVEADKNVGSGSTVRGAAGGAAAGAAVGAIAGDAGKGAAIGATLGAFRGAAGRARAKEQAAQNAQQQAAAQEQAMVQSFKKAFAACMEGKGYTVKY